MLEMLFLKPGLFGGLPLLSTSCSGSIREMAQKKSMSALFHLGVCYACITRLPKDEREAARLYEIVANHEEYSRLFKFAKCYEDSIIVEKLRGMATYFFLLSWSRGYEFEGNL